MMSHRILPENSPFFKAKALKTTNWKLEATIPTSWNRAYKMYNMNYELRSKGWMTIYWIYCLLQSLKVL
jgi:hypothetical protein